MDEAVSEASGQVLGHQESLITLEHKVEFGETVKALSNDEAFQVLLHMHCCSIVVMMGNHLLLFLRYMYTLDLLQLSHE